MEFLHNINSFDIILGVLILLLGLKGIISGFIKEASGLFGIIGGVYVASRVDMKVGHYINDIIGILHTNSAISLVGFTVSLGLFWSASYASGQVLSKILALSGLGIADRLFGFLFSAGKIFMIFSIIFYILSNTKLGLKIAKKLDNSQLYPIFVEVGSEIVALDKTRIVKHISKDVKKVIDKTENKLEKNSTKKADKNNANIIHTSKTKDIQKASLKSKDKQNISKKANKQIKQIKKQISHEVKDQTKHIVVKEKKLQEKEKVLNTATQKVDKELKEIESDIKKLKSSSGQKLDLSDDKNEVIKFN